jgi:hypothetical protein
MMSSETSTRSKRTPAAGPKGGRPSGPGPNGRGRVADAERAAAPAPTADSGAPGIQPAHVLILGTVAAATAGALLTHGTRPANIIFVVLAILATGVVALATYRMLWPLASGVSSIEPEMVGGRTRAALEREKTIVLRAIKELEFDRAMGKVSESDCEEMIGRLRARAVRLIRQLDAGSAGYRELIERELDARLGARGTSARSDTGGQAARPAPVAPPGRPAPDSALSTVVASEPFDEVRNPLSCACGAVNDADAKFCKQCGAKLGVPA